LNVNLNINNENEDCKIGTVCDEMGVLMEGGRAKEGDLGNGMWLMDFINLYETELKNLLQFPWMGWGRG
jgi:hypothetical protein